jgi:hypothetical protein
MEAGFLRGRMDESGRWRRDEEGKATRAKNVGFTLHFTPYNNPL